MECSSSEIIHNLEETIRNLEEIIRNQEENQRHPVSLLQAGPGSHCQYYLMKKYRWKELFLMLALFPQK